MGSSLLLKGGTSTPKSIVETFSLANTFAAGDAVRYDIPSSTWVKAQADSAENSEVAGVVSSAAFNTFDLTYSGYINVSALSGVSAPVLFLDSTTAGGLTTSPPSAIGTVIKPVLTKTTNGAGYIVTNYLGTQIGGSSTVAIDEIQPVGTVVPFAGSTIPDSWLECNGNSYAVGTYPNLYAKLQNSSGDRVPAYGYVVQIGVDTTVSQYATWLSLVTVGDTILYDPTQSNLLQPAVSTYTLIGRVLAKGTASVTVQVFPKYDSTTSGGTTTKNFVVPNVIPSTVGWLAAFAPVAGNTIYDFLNNTYRRGESQLASSAQVYTVSVTHFNTPDLRGRFAIGTNTTRLPTSGDLEGDAANYSAISAIYSMGSQGGEEKNSLATAGAATSTGTNCVANVANNLLNNIPPYTVVRYIIKASPYTRAAIIDGIDIPYTNLLVGDLRDGSLRPSGSGEALVFKTNDGSSGVEKMRLSNDGNLIIGSSSSSDNNPGHKFVVSNGAGLNFEVLPGYITNTTILQLFNRPLGVYHSFDLRAADFKFGTGSGTFSINSSGQVNIPATTESTSLSTGGLTLGGGLGMAKNLTVGGGISAAGGITFSGLTRVTNSTAATSPTVAAFTVAGGIGAGSLHVGAAGQSIAGPLNVTGETRVDSAAASSSTITGALRVVGGVGIQGALYVGGITTAGGISMGGALTVGGGITAARLDLGTGAIKSGSITTGAFSATTLSATATTESTGAGSGALVVAGGAGIVGALNVLGGITGARLDLGSGAIKTSGSLNCGNITSSGTFSATSLSATSTGTNALAVAGGASITGQLNATTIVASGNITAFSDSRFKEDIKTIENALEKTQALNGVSYTDKTSKEKRIGLIAQEIKEVIPEVVFVNGDDQIHSVAYGNLVGLLVQAIKELNAKVDRLSSKVDTLSSGGSE